MSVVYNRAALELTKSVKNMNNNANEETNDELLIQGFNLCSVIETSGVVKVKKDLYQISFEILKLIKNTRVKAAAVSYLVNATRMNDNEMLENTPCSLKMLLKLITMTSTENPVEESTTVISISVLHLIAIGMKHKWWNLEMQEEPQVLSELNFILMNNFIEILYNHSNAHVNNLTVSIFASILSMSSSCVEFQNDPWKYEVAKKGIEILMASEKESEEELFSLPPSIVWFLSFTFIDMVDNGNDELHSIDVTHITKYIEHYVRHEEYTKLASVLLLLTTIKNSGASLELISIEHLDGMQMKMNGGGDGGGGGGSGWDEEEEVERYTSEMLE